MKHQLRFDGCQIQDIASRYMAADLDDELIRLGPVVTERGYIDKDGLREIVRWKAHRAIHHVESNTEELVREVTASHFMPEKKRQE